MRTNLQPTKAICHRYPMVVMVFPIFPHKENTGLAGIKLVKILQTEKGAILFKLELIKMKHLQVKNTDMFTLDQNLARSVYAQG